MEQSSYGFYGQPPPGPGYGLPPPHGDVPPLSAPGYGPPPGPYGYGPPAGSPGAYGYGYAPPPQGTYIQARPMRPPQPPTWTPPPTRENDDYWSWHNEAVSKAKRLDACYNSGVRPGMEPKIKMGVASAMQRAEQAPGGAESAMQQPEQSTRSMASAMQQPEQSKRLNAGSTAEGRQDAGSKSKPPPSKEPSPPPENHASLISCLKAAAFVGALALIVVAVRRVAQFGSPDVGKEHYLECMGRLQSPSEGKCTHECLQEVMEDGFENWKMQCVPKEDRSTMKKQATLACDCQDLVPNYLENADKCCLGNVSLVSPAVKTFCKSPVSFRSDLEGVFKRYCKLNDLPDNAEVLDTRPAFSVLGIALLGSLLAGMAIAGFVKLSQSSSMTSREEQTPYLRLSA